MPQYTLQLHTDRLAPRSEARFGGCNRVIYVREGDAIVRAGTQAAGLAANSAWHGRDEVTVVAGNAGATLLRWELAAGVTSSPVPSLSRRPVPSLSRRPVPSLSRRPVPSLSRRPTLAHAVEMNDPGGYLMRCDRVDFPPGGVAWTHVHRGPGIRCLLAGSVRVEVNGTAHDVEPGGAWFEAGPDPVLAIASKTVPTAFARVMILPRELRGKSSIRYVKPEEADKPRLQTYRVFVDEFIELP